MKTPKACTKTFSLVKTQKEKICMMTVPQQVVVEVQSLGKRGIMLHNMPAQKMPSHKMASQSMMEIQCILKIYILVIVLIQWNILFRKISTLQYKPPLVVSLLSLVASLEWERAMPEVQAQYGEWIVITRDCHRCFYRKERLANLIQIWCQCKDTFKPLDRLYQ